MSAPHPAEGTLICFYIGDMSSARTALDIVGAINEIDALADVRFDLPMRRIEIVPGGAGFSDYRDAISNAGYSAIRQWPSELLSLMADPFFSYSVLIQHSESTR